MLSRQKTAGSPAALVPVALDEDGPSPIADLVNRLDGQALRLAFDSASHGMARLTPDGRLQQVNDVLCSMVGRSRAELEGGPLQLLTHPDDAVPWPNCGTG